MTVEMDAEKLANSQREAISRFFGMEVPKPGDWLFETAEKIKKEKLFKAEPFYLPRRQLTQGVAFPGLKFPLSPWLYAQIKAKTVAQDADTLPGEWVLADVTKRPNYNNGKQMYPDTKQFKEMLAGLREQGGISVPDIYSHVSKDSRFAISADEIDGNKALVSKAVTDILGLEAKQVSTPTYADFNYIGNLAHPEFGQVDTWEWFSNNFGHGFCLYGGSSDGGGLSNVTYGWSGGRVDFFGFRFQVSSPSKA